MSVQQLQIETQDQGFMPIDIPLNRCIKDAGLSTGLCTVFIRHTSASLLIQENADPAVQRDLQRWFGRLVKEGDGLYTHTSEGLDDMPAHIKCALTATSLAIPILDGRLCLGTWQSVYVWEHRYGCHQRQIVVHLSE